MPRFGEYIAGKSQASSLIGKLVTLIDSTSKIPSKYPADQLGSLRTRQVLTDGATITMNVNNGQDGQVTIGGNRTFAFSNLADNDAGLIYIKQDGTGGRTITWPLNAILPAGGLSLSSGADEVTIVGYWVIGSAVLLFKENFGAIAADTTAPSVTSIRVENATPNRVDIKYNEALLGSSVPAGSAFAPSGGRTVTGVAISGDTVQVTVNTAYSSGDTITIGYTVPGSNQIKDSAGNNAPAITGGTSVTNAIGGGGPSLQALTFGTNVGLSHTGNVWTGANAAADFENKGLDAKKIASGTDGYIVCQYKADALGCVFGFNLTNANDDYPQYECAMYLTAANIYTVQNGSLGAYGAPTVDRYYRISRTGSTIKLQWATSDAPGATWTDIVAYATSSTADLFICMAIDEKNGDGKCYYPKVYNGI